LTVDLGSVVPRPITVLVADDSASLRTLVRITLRSQGWEVVEAATPEEALAAARQTPPPDIAILDVTFGETGPDGLAVCAELKADPTTARIPIVVLTAHDDPAERRRAEAAGADAFVGKPFGPLELTEGLRRLLPARQDAPALGVLLLDAGAVEPAILESALAEQRASVNQGDQKRLGDVLLARGSVSTAALDRALLEQMHIRAMHAEGARTRVLIVDDHLAVREGLKSLIKQEEALEVIGEAPDATEGLRLARRHQPEVIVLDNEMPVRSGIDALPAFRAEAPGARIVMFSLDGTARERALAAGAHMFVSKDAPMHEILASLKPRHSGPPAQSATATLPRIPDVRQFRHAAMAIAIALVAYVGTFLFVEPVLGASAGVFAAMPVVIVGGLFGPEAGLICGALSLVLTYALWGATGHAIGEPVVLLGQGSGAVLILLLGFSAGALRIVGVRLDPRRRRVEAIAEAARALSGLDRGEFVDVFLEGLLHVAHGDRALLFLNAAGDARLIASSRGAGHVYPDRIAPLAREVMRAVSARAVDLLPEDQRFSPDLRSAVLVPISVAGQDVRGTLVVLRRDRGFSPDEVALISPFAQYLWLLLRSGPIAPITAASARAKEPSV
jgi:DNA-binding NarL/FixJ family response regulator